MGAEGHVAPLAILWPYIITVANLEASHIAQGNSKDHVVWIMADFGMEASTSVRVVRTPLAACYDELCDQRLLCYLLCHSLRSVFHEGASDSLDNPLAEVDAVAATLC